MVILIFSFFFNNVCFWQIFWFKQYSLQENVALPMTKSNKNPLLLKRKEVSETFIRKKSGCSVSGVSIARTTSSFVHLAFAYSAWPPINFSLPSLPRQLLQLHFSMSSGRVNRDEFAREEIAIRYSGYFLKGEREGLSSARYRVPGDNLADASASSSPSSFSHSSPVVDVWWRGAPHYIFLRSQLAQQYNSPVGR